MKKIVIISSLIFGLFLIELVVFTALRAHKAKSVTENGTEVDSINTAMNDTTEIKTPEISEEPEIFQPELDSQLAEILNKYSDAELTLTPKQIVTFENLTKKMDEERQKEWESLAKMDSSTFIDSVGDLPEVDESESEAAGTDSGPVNETQPTETLSPQSPDAQEQNEEQLAEARRKAFRKMAKIYSEMEASKAAEILQKMDTEVAVQILSNMRERSAAEIMNLMDPYKVIKISKQMTSVDDG